MTIRIRRHDGMPMICVNVEIEKSDYDWLLKRAERLGLRMGGAKTGISRLLHKEISEVAARECLHSGGNFHDDEALPVKTVSVMTVPVPESLSA